MFENFFPGISVLFVFLLFFLEFPEYSVACFAFRDFNNMRTFGTDGKRSMSQMLLVV